ncbi:MAG: hypothetical protein KGM44_08510 [bacterium]|nr:hypothetical protein [bacterium]
MRARAAVVAAILLGAVALPRAAAAADQSGYLSAYALRDAHYDDAVLAVDATESLGDAQRRIRPFYELAYTRDTRVAGGPLPRTFADSYVLGAMGLQAQYADGLRLFAQLGLSGRLGEAPVNAAPRSGSDFRGGVQLYRDWSVATGSPGRIASLYGSAQYYSRYGDAIAYLQAERGIAFGRGRTTDVYARLTLTADTLGYYYDNVAELGVGVRLHPFGAYAPSIALEGFGGRYLRAGSPNGATYFDLRPTLTLGFSF